MKKTILLVVMLTLVAFVSGAIAQAPAKPATTAPAKAAPAKMEKFWGSVKSMDAMAKSIVVVGKGKAEKTFMVTADTKITKGKEVLKFEDLKAGNRVEVHYKMEMDKMVAGAIHVPVPKAAPKAATTGK
ncbi:MAG: hypothetical protein ACLQGU_19645 [bacterium]